MAPVLSIRLLGAAALVGLNAAEDDSMDECLAMFHKLSHLCADLTTGCVENSECRQGLKEVPEKCESWDWYDIPGEGWVSPLEEAMKVERICNSECLLGFVGVEDACTDCHSDHGRCEQHLQQTATLCKDDEHWMVNGWNVSVAALIANMTGTVPIMCSPCTSAASNAKEVIEGECMMNLGLICQEGNTCSNAASLALAACGNSSSFYDFEEFEVKPVTEMSEGLSMICNPCYLSLMNMTMSSCLDFESLEGLCAQEGICHESIHGFMEQCSDENNVDMLDDELANTISEISHAVEMMSGMCSSCGQILMALESQCHEEALCGTHCMGLVGNLTQACSDEEFSSFVGSEASVADTVAIVMGMCSGGGGGGCMNPVFIPHEVSMKFKARLCM